MQRKVVCLKMMRYEQNGKSMDWVKQNGVLTKKQTIPSYNKQQSRQIIKYRVRKYLPVDVNDLLLRPLTSSLQLFHLLCR